MSRSGVGMVSNGMSVVSLLVHMMAWNTTQCAENCSGHGDCFNGTCVCEIQFVGAECSSTNTSYFAGFASVFFSVAFICLVQLVVCIIAEWRRLKAPTLSQACRVTTQKLLYFVVFLATTIRGAYFTSPHWFQEGWSRSLLSAYYPLILSGSSLIVCFWAEVFHLRDLRWENRQFLSKSFIAFLSFNAIIYSLLIADIMVTNYFHSPPEIETLTSHIFNGCYAALLLIVVIFFLIYGIEVYFKVRGGFLQEEASPSLPVAEETRHLFNFNAKEERPLPKSVDTSQLHQSRLGLLSQAFMLLFVIFFLCSEILGQFWKSKVPIHSRNWHNLVFRVMEIGAALWFPCVLWNCMSPEELWILNPKRLLKRKEYKTATTGESKKELLVREKHETGSINGGDCWICYDTCRTDAGPLIEPCQCRGDVRTVHHDCLLKWLMERSDKVGWMRCSVCKSDYRISWSNRRGLMGALDSHYWLGTITVTSLICASATGACLLVQYLDSAVAKALSVGTALLAIYVCLRCLCQRQMEAYQRAKVSSLNIESNHQVSTISRELLERPSTSSSVATL